jgi:hypothetical protein
LWFEASQGKQFLRPYLEKPFTKIGLVEWLKVKALSSSTSTAKKKKKTVRVNLQDLGLGHGILTLTPKNLCSRNQRKLDKLTLK